MYFPYSLRLVCFSQPFFYLAYALFVVFQQCVRNSLPMRSSLDGGVKAWMLKVEVRGGDDKSNEEGDDNGLDCQCCEVLSIP